MKIKSLRFTFDEKLKHSPFVRYTRMNTNTSFLQFLFNYRKLIFLSLVIGGLIGIGITFFMPKKYLSTAIIYPASSYGKNELVENPQFGFEVETEQLLQLMESQSMRDRTIRKFRLWNYYEMDTTDPSWHSELNLRYIKDIRFFRSKYLSVVVNVITTNPELSSRIANFQHEEVNRYRKEIFEKNRYTELTSLKQQLDRLQDTLNRLRAAIYRIKGDRSELLFGFIENLNNDNYDAGEFLDDPALEDLVDNYVKGWRQLNAMKDTYERKQDAYDKPLPSVYVVDYAEPEYKKVAPSFLVNGVVGAFLLMFLAVSGVLVSKRWKQFKQEIQA